MNKLIIEGKEIPLSDETVQAIKEWLKEKKWLWKPKDGEKYYYITGDGDASWDNELDDTIKIWNYYKTREEAENKIEWLKAVQRVKEYIAKNDMAIYTDKDKFDDSQFKFFFVYNENTEEIYRDNTDYIRYYTPIPYLKNTDDVYKIIEECKEDLLTIFK